MPQEEQLPGIAKLRARSMLLRRRINTPVAIGKFEFRTGFQEGEQSGKIKGLIAGLGIGIIVGGLVVTMVYT